MLLLCFMRRLRRAEALGLQYEARLRGLTLATQVAFVDQAEGLNPAAP